MLRGLVPRATCCLIQTLAARGPCRDSYTPPPAWFNSPPGARMRSAFAKATFACTQTGRLSPNHPKQFLPAGSHVAPDRINGASRTRVILLCNHHSPRRKLNHLLQHREYYRIKGYAGPNRSRNLDHSSNVSSITRITAGMQWDLEKVTFAAIHTGECFTSRNRR